MSLCACVCVCVCVCRWFLNPRRRRRKVRMERTARPRPLPVRGLGQPAPRVSGPSGPRLATLTTSPAARTKTTTTKAPPLPLVPTGHVTGKEGRRRPWTREVLTQHPWPWTQRGENFATKQQKFCSGVIFLFSQVFAVPIFSGEGFLLHPLPEPPPGRPHGPRELRPRHAVLRCGDPGRPGEDARCQPGHGVRGCGLPHLKSGVGI